MIKESNVITPSDVVLRAKDGTVIIEGDLKLGDGQESLNRRIERIEKLLGVGPRRPDLENKYPELKARGEQLDQEIDQLNETIIKAISNVTHAYETFANECEVMEKLNP